MRVRLSAAFAAALLVLLPAAGAGAAPGELDPAFGDGGRVTTVFEDVCHDEFDDQTRDEVFDVALQQDGKIVTAGRCGSSVATDFGLARYHPDGTLDADFGWDGYGMAFADFGDEEVARGLAIQGDGKLVAAGSAVIGGVERFALARFLPDGTLDPSFGDAGKVVTGFDGDAGISDVALQNNGRIVVAGWATPAGETQSFALARYLSNGTLDPNFGDGGTVITDVTGFSDRANAVAIQKNGRILAAGGDGVFTLARYHSNGSLDPSFGDGGTVVTAVGDFSTAEALAIDGDGRPVVAGWVEMQDEDDPALELFSRFAVARYLPDGSLDPWFGIDGKVITEFDDDSSDRAFALAIQGDGKLVAAGVTNNPAFFGSANNFGLVRYLPDGTLDFGFGSAGRVTTSFGGSDRARALAVQPDGKLLAAGRHVTSGGMRFALARYLSNQDIAPRGLGLTVPPRRERPSDMTATLRDPDTGDPVFGAAIRFLVDGRTVAEARTDRAGTATAPMPRGLNARSMVRAEFDGDGDRGPLAVEARYDPRSGISASSG